ASALQAEGRRFESVNAHWKFSFEGGLASDCKAIFLSVNFLFLKSLSFMSCYSEKSSNFAVR
ncbi:MAG: hypothetical protein ACLRYI_17445, partial [Bacteroides uniformis]